MVQLAAWLDQEMTRRFMAQIEEELRYLNVTIIAGTLSEREYSFQCGKILGLRALEDFIAKTREEEKDS